MMKIGGRQWKRPRVIEQRLGLGLDRFIDFQQVKGVFEYIKGSDTFTGASFLPIHMLTKGDSMAEASSELEGPDFEKGYETEKLGEGTMVLGHAFGEAVLVAKRGDDLFAIGATCTHYGGPLAEGLMVDCTVRCPLHHARFDLRTGEAIAAPALNNVSCYKVEKRGDRFFVTGKIDRTPVRKPKSSPDSIVIIGAGAAGGAAAEMLRRQGFDGPVTLIGADESLPVRSAESFKRLSRRQRT